MTDEQILKEVTATLRDVLDDDCVQLSFNTTASDIAKWDSLSHINLLVALEARYKIKFNTAEVEGLRNVGELVHTISAKITNSCVDASR